MPSPSKILDGILKVRVSGLIHSSFISTPAFLIYSMFLSRHRAICFLHFSLHPGLSLASNVTSDAFSVSEYLIRFFRLVFYIRLHDISITFRYLSYLRLPLSESAKLSPNLFLFNIISLIPFLYFILLMKY